MSPAIAFRSIHYPPRFEGKVPTRVRMLRTVASDIPCQLRPMVVKAGYDYPAWVNSHGAVSAVLDHGGMLGLRPDEFEVVEWFRTPCLTASESDRGS
jgi:hypothetical protein